MIGNQLAHIQIEGKTLPEGIDRGFVKVTVQLYTVMTLAEFEQFRAKPSVLRLDPARGKVQVEIAPTANRTKIEQDQFRSEYEGSWTPPARS